MNHVTGFHPCTREGCGVVCGREWDLRRHVNSVHGSLTFWCPVSSCPRSEISGDRPFPRRDKRNDHVKKVHPHHGLELSASPASSNDEDVPPLADANLTTMALGIVDPFALAGRPLPVTDLGQEVAADQVPLFNFGPSPMTNAYNAFDPNAATFDPSPDLNMNAQVDWNWDVNNEQLNWDHNNLDVQMDHNLEPAFGLINGNDTSLQDTAMAMIFPSNGTNAINHPALPGGLDFDWSASSNMFSNVLPETTTPPKHNFGNPFSGCGICQCCLNRAP